MFKSIITSYKYEKISYKILLALFSLIIVKSLFVTPFKLISGFAGILIGLCLVIIFYMAIIFLIHFIRNIEWEYKKTKVKRYMILIYMLPTVLLYGFLLAVVFPGIVPYDSLYIWEMTKTGVYTSLHPITYTLFVNVLNSIIDSPYILIIFQIIYTSFVFAMIIVTFQEMGLKKYFCWTALALLVLYPVNAMTTVAMLKDVNYMVSLMLFSIIIIRIVVTKKLSNLNIAILFFASLIALFSRHNALITIILILISLIIFFKKSHMNARKIVYLMLTILVTFCGINKIIEISLGENYWKRSCLQDIAMIPSAQLSFAVDENWYELTDEQYDQANKYLNLGYVTETVKQRVDWKFNHIYIFTLNYVEIQQDPMGFLKFYLDYWRAFPSDMILEYQQITGITWAIPNYGYTLAWNTGISEYTRYDVEIYENSVFPKLRDKLYEKPAALFLIRPALWLMLSILLIFSFNKSRGFALMAIASPMLANTFGYLIGTPAQNVRYLYCNFSIYIVLLLYSTMVYKLRTRFDKT